MKIERSLLIFSTWQACMGVFWKFVIFTIPKYQRGRPSAVVPLLKN